LVFISHHYHESPRGELFFETQCMCIHTVLQKKRDHVFDDKLN